MLGLILKNQWRSVILIFIVLCCAGGRPDSQDYTDRLNSYPVDVEYGHPGYWTWPNAIDLYARSGSLSGGTLFSEKAAGDALAVGSSSLWTCSKRSGFHTKDIVRITNRPYQTAPALFPWRPPNANPMDISPADFAGDKKYFGANSENDHIAIRASDPAMGNSAVTDMTTANWNVTVSAFDTFG